MVRFKKLEKTGGRDSFCYIKVYWLELDMSNYISNKRQCTELQKKPCKHIVVSDNMEIWSKVL